jgi:basic membrane protein A
MKRRIYAIVALLTLAAFVLGACAPAPAAEEEGPAVADVKAPADVQMPEYEAPEGEEEEAPAEEPAEPVLVGFVTDTGGIDDKSFNTTQWNGVQRAVEELGVEAQFIQSDEATEYEPNLTEFASQGYDLVIAAGFFLSTDLAKVAALYPDVSFTIVDAAYPDPGIPEDLVGYDECIPNVQGQVFKTDQAAFLAGYLAAGMTETGKLGYFGGAKIPTVTIFGVGFEQGMNHYNEVHGTEVTLEGWDSA